MAPAQPAGQPAPDGGALPSTALSGLGQRPFGVYLHVPFCATRCGYCDFNTYTAAELGSGASPAAYLDAALEEIRLAGTVLGDPAPLASTVFVGGGTPTLLPPGDLARLLGAVRDRFGLAGEAEITTEANPESVTPAYLAQLRAAGFTRVSFGMQSAVPHVLAALDRRHTPGRPEQCVTWARAAGFEQVNLDLIYGAPGETDEDWRQSLQAALAAGPDHVSAYALIVEEGTRLAAQVRRGEVSVADDDTMADRYLAADEVLAAAGLGWYEVSNWARAGAECRHNLLYWTGGDWWGVGPGAHSHVGGVRWWNVKHPAAYAGRLASGRSPAAAREVLGEEQRCTERVLLCVRLREGLPVAEVPEPGEAAALAGEGLLDGLALEEGRVRLTRNGRLLADLVVRRLLG